MKRNNQENLVSKIRAQYGEKEYTQMDALRELDAKVKRPVNIFAYVLGSVGAVIMGSGMSLVMTDIGNVIGMENTMAVGIAVGVVGMLIAIGNYPLYQKLLGRRKKEYADQILSLSDQITAKEESTEK